MVYRQILFLVLLSYGINGDTETIYLQNSCSFTIYNPNEDKSFYLEWDGQAVSQTLCSMSFKGKGGDIFDEYKVCVEPILFDLSCRDTDVEVTYSTGVVGQLRRTYGCSDTPSKFCADSDTYLDISLNNAHYGTSGYSSFSLKITAIKTFNHSAVVGGIVGGVITVVVVIVVISIICYRRRVVYRSPACTTHHGISNPAVVSTVTSSTNMTSTAYPPPPQAAYPQQPYPTQGAPQYNYPPPSYAAPPPAYHTVN